MVACRHLCGDGALGVFKEGEFRHLPSGLVQDLQGLDGGFPAALYLRGKGLLPGIGLPLDKEAVPQGRGRQGGAAGDGAVLRDRGSGGFGLINRGGKGKAIGKLGGCKEGLAGPKEDSGRNGSHCGANKTKNCKIAFQGKHHLSERIRPPKVPGPVPQGAALPAGPQLVLLPIHMRGNAFLEAVPWNGGGG